MDHERFDALARLLAATGSRRGALSACIGVALLGQGPEALAERGKEHGKGKGKSPRHHKGRDKRRGAEKEGAATGGGGGKGEGNRRDRRQRAQVERSSPRCYTGSPCIVGAKANLLKCDLGSAALENASCTQCNLYQANLKQATATGANLSKANLGKACLVDADLTGANLTGANTSGAIFCRTTMPDGSTNNSGCAKGTRCCPTCAEIGARCGNGLGGECCGGATCVNNVCTCPASKPNTCSGICAGCCTNADCESLVCCNHGCCPAGDVCFRNECCTPESHQDACTGFGGDPPIPDALCGEVVNTCGRVVDCGPCAELACQSGSCNEDTHRCQYAIDTNGQPGSACEAPQVCCAAACCDAGDVCNVTLPIPRCCTPEAPGVTCNPPGAPAPRCGMVPNICGVLVNCGPCAEIACYAGTCRETNSCDYAGNPDFTPCDTETITDGICCTQICVDGNCCSNSDCTGSSNVCAEHVCRCGENPRCSGSAPDCCGSPGACTNTATDPSNCDTCGRACASGTCQVATCTGGICGTAQAPNDTNPGGFCPGDQVCCSGSCVDRSKNQLNCGTCGRTCVPGPAPHCVAGACTCASNGNVDCDPEFTCCDSGCLHLKSDANNCGGCGQVCDARNGICEIPACIGGICGTQNSTDGVPGSNCPAPQICCDGVCCPSTSPDGPCRMPVCRDGHCRFPITPDNQPWLPGCPNRCCNGQCCQESRQVCSPRGCCLPDGSDSICATDDDCCSLNCQFDSSVFGLRCLPR